MRRTYENAQVLLAELGGSLADVVEETLFVIDVGSFRGQWQGATGRLRPACAAGCWQPDRSLGVGIPRAAD
ncbi:hypothetical protein [Stenotrophomonas maltophilia]|uniref:hypothetical protein n=1 Tax=Stenotrophomonas maltophilia TaxID=40324 RepID=UPI001FAFFB01|nr:hypothetical protein [Stenotrophomonas maltophilia]